MIFIYRLICPIENTVKYIGITKDPRGRIKGHCGESSNKDKKVWIKKLARKKLKPIMVVFDMVEKSKVKQYEAMYINLYNDNGYTLLNIVNNNSRIVRVKNNTIQKTNKKKRQEKSKREVLALNYLKSIKKDRLKKP